MQSFAGIVLGGKIGGSKGSLKINEAGIGWQTESGLSRRVAKEDLTAACWTRVSQRLFELKLIMRGGGSLKFQGFRDADFDLFSKHMKDNFGVTLERTELSVKGKSWGNVDYLGNSLVFNVDGKQAFELPLTDVTKGTIPPTARNEVSIEFTQESTLEEEDESLIEIRFFVPQTDKPKAKADGEDVEDGEINVDEKTSAQRFLDQVLSRSDTSTVGGGKSIVTLPEVPILNPRGRFQIEMFPSFMKLRGKSYDYKINYDTVSRLFLLNKPDQRHVYFIVSLDPPIRQGAQRYYHLIMHFPKDEISDFSLHLGDDKEDGDAQGDAAPETAKYKDKLQKEMTGETYKLVTQIFKALTDRKVTVSGTFRSHSSLNAIKCSMKANEGFLYPLERSFFFVPKPPTYIRYEDIQNIEFARVASGVAGSSASASRTFDLLIMLKNSTSVQFSSVQRQEYTNLFNFIVSKKIKIVNPEGEEVVPGKMAGESSSTTTSTTTIANMDDDDDEEEDEDFVGGDEDEDVDEEFNEDAESDADSGEAQASDEEAKKKKKKKEGKDKGKEKGKEKDKEKEKKKKRKSSESESDEGSSKKKK